MAVNGAVPVWFLTVEDYQAALPGLFMSELLAMPSLMRGPGATRQESGNQDLTSVAVLSAR
jgi:hypothetical protein